MMVLRSIGAVVAGIVVVMILVVAVEILSGIVHPVSADFKGTFEEVCQHVERYPQWGLAAAIAAWGFTAFAGIWIAGRLGNRASAVFLGLLLLSAVILNISMLPYPLWFRIGSLIAISIGIVCGYRLSSRRTSIAGAIELSAI